MADMKESNGAEVIPMKERVANEDDRSSNPDAVVLRRQVGLLECVTIVVGVIIGSGIFISPKGILENTGTVGASLLVWLGCGIMSSLGALCYAELGTTFPKSGGDYVYILEAFGPLVAFLRIWTSLLAIKTGTMAVLAIAFAQYCVAAFYPICEPPQSAVKLLAAAILCGVFYLNCVSVTWTTRVQTVLTFVKTIGLIIIIITGFVLLFQGKTTHLKDAFTGAENTDVTKIPLAFYAGLFAYSGWQYVSQITEEIVNPSRNLPLGIMISMGLVTVIYLATNVAYFAQLSPQELLNSNAVAVSFASDLYGVMLWIVPVFVSLSCAGSLNGCLLSDSRGVFAAAREGHFPTVIAMIDVKRRTPTPAILCMLPICLLMLMGDSVYSLINYLSFTGFLFIGITVAVIPYWRWKFPELERPFSVPMIVPITFLLCCVFVVGVSLYSAPVECCIGLVITLAGIPVYFLFIYWQNKPQWFIDYMRTFTINFQKTFMVVYQEKKTY
ncbi:cystine/glutamate transporter-like isoform X1 [Antedon mediterranea]|uniref:cystine/glutamate transporter-like isoform X1 n=1 Tax=Antedon mediterranea TaxID=105859 RepID=UPI003AF74529